MRIFLIGFMGSGKTTMGKQLAAKLGYQFVDQDHEVENKFKMSVNEIFATHGEATFRKAEREVLLSFENKENLVISTGGGAPCFFDNIQLMNKLGCSIYLKADPKTLVTRLKDSHNTRPLIKDKSEPELFDYVSEKLKERETFYNQATITIQAINLRATDIIRILNEGLIPPHHLR
jgi:shikimate kinase